MAERTFASPGGEQQKQSHQLARLTETIEALQSNERKFRARMASLEQQLVSKQAEIDSLRVLPSENSLIREENVQLREKIRELEMAASRIVETATYTTESQASLGVKLQAYQRHNNFLQGELSARESRIKTLQEKMDILAEELEGKEKRLSILVEKLRSQNIDPSTSDVTVHVPQEVYSQMKQKIHSQAATVDVLHEKVEALQDDMQRREVVVEALQRENRALRQSVSRLIGQLNGSGSQGSSPDSAASKLRTFRQQSSSSSPRGASSPAA